MNHRDRSLPVLVDSVQQSQMPAVPLSFAHPGLSISQIFSILRAYRGSIVLILLSVLAATVLILSIIPRTYTAIVSLIVNYEVNDPLNGKELPIGLLSGYISTQVELMQNPEVLLSVVDRLKLTKHKDYTEGYHEGTGSLREWAAKQVSKNLIIYQGQLGSQLIYVSFSAHNSQEAAQIANSVVDTYLSLSQARALKAQLAGRVRVLETQLADEESQMLKLKISLGDYHPQVQELQTQIEFTRRGLAAAMQGDLSNAVATAHTPRQPAEGVSANSAAQKDQASAPSIATRSAAEITYNLPRSQYANVSVVSRAAPPVKPVKPNFLKGMVIGTMAAFALAFGIPVGYELFNRRVRCRDDLERHHGVPVLVEFSALPMIRTTL